eukprot:492441_1
MSTDLPDLPLSPLNAEQAVRNDAYASLKAEEKEQETTADTTIPSKPNTSGTSKPYDPEIVKTLIGWGFTEEVIKEAMDAVDNPNDINQLAKYIGEKVSNTAYDEYKDHGIEMNNTQNIDKTVIKFPVQVFVRFRPLIKEEIDEEHKQLQFKTKSVKKSKSTTLNINDITKKARKSAIKKKKSKSDKPAIKSFKRFRSVLTQTDDNQSTFKTCILPSIHNIFKGYTVCAFAYGHTGSGKTHTILGYDDEKRAAPGMYRQTVEYITEKLRLMGESDDIKSDETLISCRFAELYQGKMRDLFGDLVECHVREDDDGNINIRGPTIKDEATGKVSVQPLTPVYIKQDEADKLIGEVKKALKLRNVGSSTLHDESSRSHCFLEMELVTKTLVEARDKLLIAEANIVPVGKARDDMKIEMEMKMLTRDETTGKYGIDPNWKPNKEANEKLDKLQADTDRLQGIIDQYKEDIRNEINDNKDKGIGGTVVFVDLAGNEYGQDSKNSKTDNKIQASERKEINKSLLSLKECIRALHSHKAHVPYRDSKLTMVLRPHLKGKNSTAIMIANVSPSEVHVNKTY